MNTLVLYHDNCPDGFTAAWAVWRRLGDEAKYRAVNYGQEPPVADALGRRVILVDFSYSRPGLNALREASAQLVIYDHHKTAEADLLGWVPRTQDRVVFDMERSGAGIAWDEFHPGEATWIGLRPSLVSYVEDRDLWRWALPSSREVSEYLFSLPRTFQEWDRVDAQWGPNTGPPTEAFGRAVIVGEALLRAKRQRVEVVCNNVRWMVFSSPSGHVRLPVVNAAWDFSELGEYLCERFPEAPAGGYYFDRTDKRQWGFRSRAGFDVSALCRVYGGGGHAAAAGFTSAIGWEP